MNGYVVTLARLTVLAVLCIAALGSARVLVQLRIEQHRKRQLANTDDISALTPSEFERYVGMLFEEAGYRVQCTGGRGDHGVDLTVSRRGTPGVVQCKRYEDAVGPGTVRELIGAMTNADVQEGFLIATSTFTAGARAEAEKAPYRVTLIDGEDLVRWARTYGLPGELMGRE